MCERAYECETHCSYNRCSFLRFSYCPPPSTYSTIPSKYTCNTHTHPSHPSHVHAHAHAPAQYESGDSLHTGIELQRERTTDAAELAQTFHEVLKMETLDENSPAPDDGYLHEFATEIAAHQRRRERYEYHVRNSTSASSSSPLPSPAVSASAAASTAAPVAASADASAPSVSSSSSSAAALPAVASPSPAAPTVRDLLTKDRRLGAYLPLDYVGVASMQGLLRRSRKFWDLAQNPGRRRLYRELQQRLALQQQNSCIVHGQSIGQSNIISQNNVNSQDHDHGAQNHQQERDSVPVDVESTEPSVVESTMLTDSESPVDEASQTPASTHPAAHLSNEAANGEAASSVDATSTVGIDAATAAAMAISVERQEAASQSTEKSVTL